MYLKDSTSWDVLCSMGEEAFFLECLLDDRYSFYNTEWPCKDPSSWGPACLVRGLLLFRWPSSGPSLQLQNAEASLWCCSTWPFSLGKVPFFRLPFPLFCLGDEGSAEAVPHFPLLCGRSSLEWSFLFQREWRLLSQRLAWKEFLLLKFWQWSCMPTVHLEALLPTYSLPPRAGY